MRPRYETLDQNRTADPGLDTGIRHRAVGARRVALCRSDVCDWYGNSSYARVYTRLASRPLIVTPPPRSLPVHPQGHLLEHIV